MIIPNEALEENRRLKERVENAEDEMDRLLYQAAKVYSNKTAAKAKAALETVLERVKPGFCAGKDDHHSDNNPS